MYVFVRRNLLPAITNIESESTPSGYAGVMGNKGGVSVRFEICGVNLIILSCHFTAHKENQRDRLNDYLDIINHQSFRDEDVNVILDHDYVFWMGDLNFRLENITKTEAEKLIIEKRFSELLKHDQLNMMKNQKLIFQDFCEGEINFPPTFKFDKGTEIYDSRLLQKDSGNENKIDQTSEESSGNTGGPVDHGSNEVRRNLCIIEGLMQ
ncbi:unnamed protein product [Echinostoma caproni]|uniref:IPPc domain-containing protein n=1 Tax=Echinostoma caproni TaxID=27848 RepID=A0A182ZZX6_9TREM|nr:unnamed protein product [Echinostoma caproni]